MHRIRTIEISLFFAFILSGTSATAQLAHESFALVCDTLLALKKIEPPGPSADRLYPTLIAAGWAEQMEVAEYFELAGQIQQNNPQKDLRELQIASNDAIEEKSKVQKIVDGRFFGWRRQWRREMFLERLRVADDQARSRAEDLNTARASLNLRDQLRERINGFQFISGSAQALRLTEVGLRQATAYEYFQHAFPTASIGQVDFLLSFIQEMMSSYQRVGQALESQLGQGRAKKWNHVIFSASLIGQMTPQQTAQQFKDIREFLGGKATDARTALLMFTAARFKVPASEVVRTFHQIRTDYQIDSDIAVRLTDLKFKFNIAVADLISQYKRTISSINSYGLSNADPLAILSLALEPNQSIDGVLNAYKDVASLSELDKKHYLTALNGQIRNSAPPSQTLEAIKRLTHAFRGHNWVGKTETFGSLAPILMVPGRTPEQVAAVFKYVQRELQMSFDPQVTVTLTNLAMIGAQAITQQNFEIPRELQVTDSEPTRSDDNSNLFLLYLIVSLNSSNNNVAFASSSDLQSSMALELNGGALGDLNIGDAIGDAIGSGGDVGGGGWDSGGSGGGWDSGGSGGGWDSGGGGTTF